MHSWVTIALPFDGHKADAARVALRAMGNPASPTVRDALRQDLKIHFVSGGVFPGDTIAKAHIVIEASSDLPPDETVDLLARRLTTELTAAFAAAGLPTSDLAGLMRRHRVKTGQGLFDQPGLDFTGTPGMTVARIRDEWDLARKVRDLFDAKAYGGTALEMLGQARADIAADPVLSRLLKPEPAPLLKPPPPGSASDSAVPLAVGAVMNFLWPVGVLGLIALVAALWFARGGGAVVMVLVALAVLGLTVAAGLGVAAAIYLGLRKREKADRPDESLPDEAVLRQVAQDENRTVQNHMTGVSRIKPGKLRRFTLRLAFWVIGTVAGLRFRPGFLGDIGTIHFARWVLLPGTDKLLFFSNYGGSWESYLEDFITKANDGLTAVWSNTEGFPRTSNLIFEGASNGDQFKRWARRQQQPTAFWYSAYPHVTTARIRANAAIRQGLATAATREEAELWLAQLGSRTPPPSLLETSEIQTLLFGGLKHHPHAVALMVAMPEKAVEARAWLRAARAQVGFGDQPDPRNVGMLALAPGALAKAGLAADSQKTFAFAFRQGMADPARTKILEDTGDDKPQGWIWGSGANTADAALVLYGASARDLAKALRTAEAALADNGGRVLHKVPLRTLGSAAQKSGGGRRNQEHEAFGFADGVSQPIIKGTRRWMSGRDEIHAVEPGEIILGYPDNRGNWPLTPTAPASSDPDSLLPTVAPPPAGGHAPDLGQSHANLDRDLGRNGTYLVIRQLAQDRGLFEQSVDKVAVACAGHPGVPPGLTAPRLREWIGAKIIGRWRDGTSLVRYPHRPGTGWDGKLDAEPDNAFLLGAEDPVGERCPFGAHIRRTNPRESFEPGSMEQLAISNRHRILRAGRPYETYRREDGGREGEGLFFMCFNADIERQFEFIQQTWSMAPQFHGLENEVDGILGRGEKNGRLTIPTPHGPLQVKGLRDVVQVRGGGYFFVPGKSALDYLCGPSATRPEPSSPGLEAVR